jgi:phosphate starvation-inducible PhoH-like protein
MMPIVKKTLFVPETINPVFLFGQHDSFLRKLKTVFSIEIGFDNNEILLKSDNAESVMLVEQLFEEMLRLLQSGHIPDEIEKQYILDTYASMKEAHHTTSEEIGSSTITEWLGREEYFFKKIKIRPKTEGQAKYIETLKNNDITFAIGPAGTGKTYLAVAMAIEALKSGIVQRIILTRPAVEAGENLGFLPGTLIEKVDPYLRPLYDSIFDMIPMEKFLFFKEKQIIEIAPLAYMRGRTLNNSYIILDEAQNTTHHQMKMFLTRIGFHSKAVITGDITQIDLKRGIDSGLIECERILKMIKGIGFSYFGKSDVIRHPLVKKIIAAYEEEESSLCLEDTLRIQENRHSGKYSKQGEEM